VSLEVGGHAAWQGAAAEPDSLRPSEIWWYSSGVAECSVGPGQRAGQLSAHSVRQREIP
jgi:hypothetical protein